MIYSILLCLTTYAQAKRLKHYNVWGLKLHIDEQALIVPGNNFEIGIEAILYNDKSVYTRGLLNGKIGWSSFDIKVQGGQYRFGKIVVASRRSNIPNGRIHIEVTNKFDESHRVEAYIPLNKVEDIAFITTGNYDNAPGEKTSFQVVSAFDNGAQSVEDYGLFSLFKQSDYHIRIRGGEHRNGTLFISEDIDHFDKHRVLIDITDKRSPEYTAGYQIELDYRKHYLVERRGMPGRGGTSGSDGSNGSTGGDGGDGRDGYDGYNGSRGPDIHVYVDAYYDTILAEKLLKVNVKSRRKGDFKRYLINPDGGSMMVRSIGGTGGDGGYGGDGGDGGDGADGGKYIKRKKINDSTWVEEVHYHPGENGGNGGDGGDGGDGGNGGNGGDIYLMFTDAGFEYESLIITESLGGYGGSDGWGGSGGKGGRGGDGEPRGRSGSSGWSGTKGSGGWDGHNGEIYVERVEEIPW